MRSVFLIGATGRIGGHLLRDLAGDRQAGRLRLKVAARTGAAAERARTAGADPVAFDLDRPADFQGSLAGSDTVFLLRPYSIAQLIQGKQVIDAAVRARVSSIVLLGAHGRPDTPHPIIGWNFLVEAWAERSGLSWTHIRPNFFMENILAQRDAVSGSIYNRLVAPVSWVASEDIAAVAAAAIRDPAAHAGQAYSIATDRRTTAGIARLFSEASARPHRIVRPSRDAQIAALVGSGREPVYAEALADYVDAINAGGVPDSAEIFDTVGRIAGRPGMTWERFIAENIAP